MSHENNTQQVPQPTANEKANYDADFLEDDNSPETTAEQVLFEERQDIARASLDEYFSERDSKTMYVPTYIREKQLEPAVQEKWVTKNHFTMLGSLARSLGQSKLSNEEIPVVVNSLTRAASLLDPIDREPSLIGGSLTSAAETVEDAQLLEDFAHAWADKLLGNLSQDESRDRIRDFNNVIDKLWNLGRTPRLIIEPGLKAEIFTEALTTYDIMYNYKTLHEHSRGASNVTAIINHFFIDSAMRRKDAGQLTNLNQLFKAILNDDPSKTHRFFDVATRYGANHGLDSKTVNSLVNNLLPAMEVTDSAVEVLNEGGNIGGMGQGDFGYADYLCHAYSREVTPGNLNELMMVLREIPTSNLARMEQNRQDGLKLAGTFGILRDFIHDQQVGVHEVISEMLKYKSTGDPRGLKAAMDKTHYFGSGNKSNQEAMLDLDNYDSAVGSRADNPGNTEPVLDILHQLEKNTRPIDEVPPELTGPVMNELFTGVYNAPQSDRKNAIAEATSYLNAKLCEMMAAKTAGVEPSLISGLAWLEQEQFKLLRDLTFEDQIGLAKQTWFKEALKFHDLTHNNYYNETEFSAFLEELQGKNDTTAFRAIVKRVLGQVQELAENYTQKGKKHWTNALWSGNTTHELIGLVDPRRAATAVGRRLLAERGLF